MGTYWQGLLLQPDCHACPLRGSTMVLPNGPIPTKLCFVGEGPGRSEVAQGQGFVGDSGKVLWKLAAAYGAHRDDIWVTNAALCAPRDVTLTTGAVLPLKQVKDLSVNACRRRLIYELLYVTGGDPTAVIVPIGNLALRALCDRKNATIYKYRGAVMEVDLPKLWQEVSQQQAAW